MCKIRVRRAVFEMSGQFSSGTSMKKLPSHLWLHAEKAVAMDNARQRSIRTTFLVFSFALSVASYKFYPSFGSYAFVTLALLLFFTSIFRPSLLGPLFTVWLKIGRTIGKFNTIVLLGMIFFLVFLPSRLITRLVGRDFMKRKFSDDESYWEDYRLAGLDDKSRYERQF
jgi:hypothetical protein